MESENTGIDLPEELIDALQERLSGEGSNPQHAVDDSASEDVVATKPTDPEVYAETDPNDTRKEVVAGDPGTYSGEYDALWRDDVEEISQRDDLPEGYMPGSYNGEYKN